MLQQSSIALTLVSDLRKTPCFLINMDMLGRAIQQNLEEPSSFRHSIERNDLSQGRTSIYLPKYDVEFSPHSLLPSTVISVGADSSDPTHSSLSDSYPLLKYNVEDDYREFQSALGYMHASVTQPRTTQQQQDISFLAEIDLPYDDAGLKGHLVMGINNHHVGSYYWARSAGMGSSMEAPGVTFRPSSSSSTTFSSRTDHRGILCWEDDRGPWDCNSNDGKRSEWVNFLRKGDTVQLVPECFEECLMEFWIRSQTTLGDVDPSNGCCDDKYGIYGFSSMGRPLGSEPILTCKWKLNKTVD